MSACENEIKAELKLKTETVCENLRKMKACRSAYF